jgi:hypothetical protein
LERAASMKKLTKQQKREIAAVAKRKDGEIDQSDIPEILDWSEAEIGKFFQQRKKPGTLHAHKHRPPQHE